MMNIEGGRERGDLVVKTHVLLFVYYYFFLLERRVCCLVELTRRKEKKKKNMYSEVCEFTFILLKSA